MKKINRPSFFFFALTLLLLPSQGQAQYYSNDETTVGILVESTFSGFDHHGITPSFTVGCSTYQFQVGPRITFDQMAGNQDENSVDRFWDFGFRYGFFLKHNFTLFAAARCEYGTHRMTEDWYYEYPTSTMELDLGDNSFNARTAQSHYNFNFYIGLGAEIILVDKLYVTAFGGAGIKTLSGYTQYWNMDNNELVTASNWLFDKRGFGWMVSAGVGYRL